ncbi:hypothetical protein V6N11_079172 [Hibiscus sabdariffa]|uniref:Endonuclease/exonuclease/phosphatase domain-containing protein n=1 Tax=Hibiscus sabdariffa TaxID=183260 RepID=A0ABR2RUM9_9ROSI
MEGAKEVRNVEGRINQIAPVWVASQGKVVAANSSLPATKNVAVQVLDLALTPSPRATKGRVLPSSIREARLSNLMEDLDNAETLEASRLESCPSLKVGDGDRVSWVHNSAFEQVSITDMQGAFDTGFNSSFKLLIRKHRHYLVIVMEPRISESTADKIIRITGFDRSFWVEARGFAGSIWVLWRDSINVDVLAVSNQYIHCFCSVPGEAVVFFATFIYASPDACMRRGLWSQLEALRLEGDTPWVLGGDLNVIHSPLERQGRVRHRAQACQYFCDFLLDSVLLDMGFKGPRFTWKRGTLSQRLDRCICSPDWDRQWNTKVFSHIGRRKNQLLARIKGVESALENTNSSYLLLLEEELKRELGLVLTQEESLWYQKVRTQWIENGDHNTTFFHMATIVQNRHNRINML